MHTDSKQGLKRYFILSTLGILLSLALAMSLLFWSNYRQATHEHYEELRDEVLRSKREFIKDAIDRTILYIEQERAMCASERYGRCDEVLLKERLREHIRAIRLKDDGYIWINAVLNYEGGDNYAYRFVHPNLPKTEGMMLSTGMKDIKGNTPYLTELEGVKAKGEIFFDYWFKKMNSDLIQHKLTYAKLYKPYNWIVATGVYLDDVDGLVQAGMARWESTLRRNLLSALVATGVASLLAWICSLLVGRRIDRIFSFFIREVDKREKELVRFNLELEERVAIRTKEIEASEKKYFDLYENAPDMYVSVDAETGLIERCNRTLSTVLGYPKEEIVGRSLFDLYHPDCRDEAICIYGDFAGTGEVRDRELILCRRDGTKLHVSLSVSAVYDEGGVLLYSRSTLRDITGRKRNDAINASRLHLMQFAATHSMDALLEAALVEAEKLTDSRIGFYHLVHEDERLLTLQAWSPRTKAEFCTVNGVAEHYPIAKAGVWVDCVHQRQPVIHNDYGSLPHRKGIPEGHPEVVRELVVPVLRGGKIKSILGVGNKPSDYDEQDVEAIQLLIDLVWEIVERKQIDEELRTLNEELERRVAERTAELAIKNEELEKLNRIFVGRELRMVELKEKISKLEAEAAKRP